MVWFAFWVAYCLFFCQRVCLFFVLAIFAGLFGVFFFACLSLLKCLPCCCFGGVLVCIIGMCVVLLFFLLSVCFRLLWCITMIKHVLIIVVDVVGCLCFFL